MSALPTSPGHAPSPPLLALRRAAEARFQRLDPPATLLLTASLKFPRDPAGNAPEGTVFNGKRKRIVPSPFGPTIVWEDVK